MITLFATHVTPDCTCGKFRHRKEIVGSIDEPEPVKVLMPFCRELQGIRKTVKALLRESKRTGR